MGRQVNTLKCCSKRASLDPLHPCVQVLWDAKVAVYCTRAVILAFSAGVLPRPWCSVVGRSVTDHLMGGWTAPAQEEIKRGQAR
jgi:hypothetical protein